MTDITLSTDKTSYLYGTEVILSYTIFDAGQPFLGTGLAWFVNDVLQWTIGTFFYGGNLSFGAPQKGSTMTIRMEYAGDALHGPASASLVVPLTRPPPTPPFRRVPTTVDWAGPYPGYGTYTFPALTSFLIGFKVYRGDSFGQEVVGAILELRVDGRFKGTVDTAEQNLFGWQTILVPAQPGPHELVARFVGNDDFEPSEQRFHFTSVGPVISSFPSILPSLGLIMGGIVIGAIALDKLK